MKHFDAAIIGAGFGGLGAALTLAEGGANVVVFETLVYPGGCASTFSRQGYRFESGATLFSGFGQGQLFRRWIDDHDLDVQFQPIDPVVTLRSQEFELPISRHREQFIDQFCALPQAPADDLRTFFSWQKKVADALWELFDDETLLPPLNPTTLSRHLLRSPRYLPLLPTLGRSLGQVLRRRQLWDYRPLRTYVDAVCQITVQTSADEAEAPFALAAMDYFFRGTGHIRHGIGEFARAVTDAIEALAGTVSFADPVFAARPHPKGWHLETRRHQITCDNLVANVLPTDLMILLGDTDFDRRHLLELSNDIKSGWGAAMLYLGLDARQLEDPKASHLELIDRADQKLIEGNHLFCSISGADETWRAPEGQRVATISTHVDMNKMWQDDQEKRAAYIDAIHDRMRQTLARRGPTIHEAICFEMTASPRTFQRFTKRHRGFVGGVPRRVGLHNYRHLRPVSPAPNLYLVGDTVFPGQSILAAALGGVKVAQMLL